MAEVRRQEFLAGVGGIDLLAHTFTPRAQERMHGAPLEIARRQDPSALRLPNRRSLCGTREELIPIRRHDERLTGHAAMQDDQRTHRAIPDSIRADPPHPKLARGRDSKTSVRALGPQ